MRVVRPIFVSAVITWFFSFHVAWPFSGLLMLIVDLGETLATGGLSRFQLEFDTMVTVETVKPLLLLRAVGVLIILAGAWNMKRWGLFSLLIFLVYVLHHYIFLASGATQYWAILALVVSILGVFKYSYFGTRKQVEEIPETHIYEGPVPSSSHEPKSAIDDLIYKSD